jgi:hypothetical protein
MKLSLVFILLACLLVANSQNIAEGKPNIHADQTVLLT